MPAFAIATSIPPKRSTVPSTAPRTASKSVTSASNHDARGPSRSARACSRSGSRPTSATFAPRAWKRSALAAPMPRAAPVMNTVRQLTLKLSAAMTSGRPSRAHEHLGALGRDHRDVAMARALGRGIGGEHVGAARDRSQDHALLSHRQGGAEAAADAAAERYPRVGARLHTEEALGAKRKRLGVEVLAMVQQQDADEHRGACGQTPLSEL